jgi:hypothetical protein
MELDGGGNQPGRKARRWLPGREPGDPAPGADRVVVDRGAGLVREAAVAAWLLRIPERSSFAGSELGRPRARARYHRRDGGRHAREKSSRR